MRKITPCLWFDFQAEEAVAHYLRVFRGGRILSTSHYGDAMPAHRGKVLLIRFEIEGQELTALNGGPQFPFTEAVSLAVDCADQAELDRLWDALGEGGAPGPCGWLKDRYGLSWQLVPSVMETLLHSGQPERIDRMMRALMQMGKLDIAALQAAYDGR